MKTKLLLLLGCIFSFSIVTILVVHHQLGTTYQIDMRNDQLTDETLKVVTYNIQYGKGIDDHVNLQRTIDTLKELDADIVALQEIERFSVRSGFQNQIEIIADALNMNAIFYPSLSFPGLYYGNAILTRFPIQDTSILHFPSKKEKRLALMTELKLLESESVFVINTHLSLDKIEREKSYKLLQETIKQLDQPVILTGDFNSTPQQKEYNQLDLFVRNSNEGKQLQTFHSKDWQIDYIFHSLHFLVEHVWTTKSKASDHYPLGTTFQVAFKD